MPKTSNTADSTTANLTDIGEPRSFLMTETDGTWTEEESLTPEEYSHLKTALRNLRNDKEMDAHDWGESRGRAVFDLFSYPNWTVLSKDKTAEIALRGSLLREIRKRINELPLSGLFDLAACMEAIENEAGCSTPAEEFITILANFHTWRGLTPADAERYLEQFRENFETTLRDSKLFSSRYAPLLGTPAA